MTHSKKILIHLSFLTLLVLLSLRDFLFGRGFFFYRDFVWQVNPDLWFNIGGFFNPTFLSAGTPDAQGFLRSAITWPIAVLGSLGLSPEGTQRAALVYMASGLYILSYFAAASFLRLAGYRTNPRRKEAVVLLYILVSFTNPFALFSQSSAAYSFLWGPQIITLIVTLFLLMAKERKAKWGFVSGSLLGVAPWLDPRLYVWGVLVLLLVVVSQSPLPKRCLGASKNLALVLATSFPAVLLTSAAYELAGQGLTNPSPVRPATLDSLRFLSGNSQPLYVFPLLGQWWTYITYAPPTVLLSTGRLEVLPIVGNPPFMLFPLGPISAIWFFALFITPILAFSALYARKFRPYSILFAGISLLGLTLSMGTQVPIPFVPEGEVLLGLVPIFGPIWQTTVGVPGAAQVITVSGFVPLFTMTILSLMDSPSLSDRIVRSGVTNNTPSFDLRLTTARVKPRRPKMVILATILVLLSLGSWQFATGSFYPSAYLEGLPGNGIPNHGTLDPILVPPSVRILAEKLTAVRGPVGVYWPIGTPASDKISPPLPLRLLVRLMEEGASEQVSPLLSAYGIRYMILQNPPRDPSLYFFGDLKTVPSLANFLASSPGISLLEAEPPEVWLFENHGMNSTVFAANLPIEFSGKSERIPLLIALAERLGYAPVLIPPEGTAIVLNHYREPVRATIDGMLSNEMNNSELRIYTPPRIGLVSPSNVAYGFNGQHDASIQVIASPSGTTSLQSPYQNWSVTVWSPKAVNITVVSGRELTIQNTGSPASVSLNFLSPLANGQADGIVVPEPRATIVTVHGSLEFRTSADFSGDVSGGFIANNLTLMNYGGIGSNVYHYSPNWSAISFSGTLPLDTSVFAMRASYSGSGILHIRKIALSWSFARMGGGGLTNLQTVSPNLAFPLPNQVTTGYTVIAEAKGQGTLLAGYPDFTVSRTVNSTSFTLYLLFVSGASGMGLLRTTGTVTLGTLAFLSMASHSDEATAVDQIRAANEGYFIHLSAKGPSLVVFSATYNRHWEVIGTDGVSSAPLLTEFGTNLFLLPSGGNYTLRFDGLDQLRLGLIVIPSGYVLLLVTALGLSERIRPLLLRWLGRLLRIT